MWVAFVRVLGLYARTETGQLALVRDGRVWDVTPSVRGVRPGHRAREAQLACPDLRLVTYDPTQHDRLLPPYWDCLAAAAPFVEPVHGRGHEAFCAWPGHRPERELDALRTAYPDARLGLATNRLVARIACPPRPDIRVVAPGTERGALATLPVKLLWTLDPPVSRRLMDLGLYTAGDVAATPEHDLVSALGPDGLRAHLASRGVDHTPVRALYPPRTVRAARSFEPPLVDGLHEALADVCGAAAAGLQSSEGTCRLFVQVTSDRGTASAERRWPAPCADRPLLCRAAAALARRFKLVASVNRVEVTLADLAVLPPVSPDLLAAPERGPVEVPGVRRGVHVDRYELLVSRFDPLLGGGEGATD